MTMASQVEHKRNPIGMKSAIIEPFVPLGYSRKKGRVQYWSEQMRRMPFRYAINNFAVIMMLVAYNEIHQGGPVWEAIHFTLALPSTFIAARAVVMMKRARGEKADA